MHGETSSPATTDSPGWRKPAWWPAVSRWQALAALISSVTVLPLLVIALSFADVNADIWAHLSEFVLPRLLANTALLLLGVGVGVLLLGVPLGWLVAVHEFPRRVFQLGADAALGHAGLCDGLHPDWPVGFFLACCKAGCARCGAVRRGFRPSARAAAWCW